MRQETRIKSLPFAAVLILFPVPSVAPEPRQRLPVIDMRMHAHQIPLELPGGAPPPCLPAPCQPRGQTTATPEESLKKTLEAMDRYTIVKGFLSSPDLDMVRAWVAAAPDRFIASPFIVEPGQLALEMLRREYTAGRLAGTGEIGSQLVGVAPNDPALAPYFAVAGTLRESARPFPVSDRLRAVRCSSRRCSSNTATSGSSSKTAAIPISMK